MAIDIKVSDGVDSSIATKLLSIANGADSAQKNVDALVKRLQSLDAAKLRAVNKATIDASKVSLNTQREAYYAAKEKVELAKLKTQQAKTAAEDGKRISQFAANAQAQATKKSLDAERVAQARLATAEKSAKAAVTNAEAMTKQAAANVKTQYQNQLLQYTGNWAKQDNNQRNTKTQIGQAQLGVVQGRQDEILARTILAQQRLTTEVARGAKENANAAVSQQRLTTEQQRTAAASTAAATAQQRLAAASSAASSAAARASASIAGANARMSNIRTSAASGAGGIRELSSAMSQLDTSASFLRSDGLRWAKVMWALGGATLTAGAVVAAADAYTLLQNRLTVVAEKQEDVNMLTNEMFEIANRTRTPVADTAKSFVRFDLAMKEMGRTQKDTIVLTETVGKALQMSGATAGEAASAMLQLSQAFNKGKLDGDEFRSVMENAPLIANALAKELNVTRGELLQLAPAGKLTVDQLTKAILNASDGITEMFDKFKFTIAQSFQILKNTMTQYFGELDKAVGFTQGLSALILGLANNLDLVTFAFLAAAPAVALFVGSKMLAGFGTLLGFLGRTSTAIGAIRSPITVVATGLVNLTRQGITTGATLRTAFAGATTAAAGFRVAVSGAAVGMGMLGVAAQRAGAMMMAAFSFGNIVLIIGTLIAAAIAFGDKIEMAGEKSFTMRDYVISAFAEIWDFTKFVFESVYDFIADMFGKSGVESMTFGEKVLSTFENVVMFGAAMVDALQQVFKVLWKSVRVAVAAVAGGIKGIAFVASEFVVGIINTAIGALNGLGAVANAILTATGADALFGTFSQVGTLVGMEFKSSLRAELASDWGMDTDVMDAAATGLGRVKDRAIARNKANSADGNLRGYDAAQAARFAAAQAANEKKKKEKKPKKTDAERRADIILKAMLAEEKAIAIARQYGDERERVNAVESVNTRLKEKNFAIMTASEESALRALVDQRLEAERVGKALQSMYEDVVNPLREFKAGQQAADILLKDGVISAARYGGEINKLTKRYAEATDAAFALKEQMDALTNPRYGTIGKFGVDAEIATNQKAAADKDGYLTDEKAAEIEALTRSMYSLKKVQEASQAVWDETYGAQESIGYQIDAVTAAYHNGSLGLAEYTRQAAGLQAQHGALLEQMYGLNAADPFEPMRRGLYQLVAEMPSLGQAMADTLQSTLGSAIDQISDLTADLIMDFDGYAQNLADTLEKPVSTLDVLKHALGDIITMIGKELISAIIKMGIQWAIQAAMSKTIEAASAATTVATQMATATAVQAAWAPAAISASIATLGGASAIGMGSYMTAQATGMAMNFLPGFADGGEISGRGTGRSDSILARLSNGEHVVKADAAERHRPLLNAMNAGMDVGIGGGTQVNIDVDIVINSDGTVDANANDNSQMTKMVTERMRQVATEVVMGMTKQGQPLYNGGRR